MKSSIKAHLEPIAEQDGKGLQPIIAIKLVYSENDDDTRDYTLKSFFDELGEKSKWLKIKVNHHIQDTQSGEVKKFISIYPVHPSEFPKMLGDINAIMEKDENFGIMIGDNSIAFRDFLDEKNIKYCNQGHYTSVRIFQQDVFTLGKNYQDYLSKKYPNVSLGYVNVNLVGFDIKKSSVDLSIFESFCTVKNIKFYYNGDPIRVTSPDIDAFELALAYTNFKNEKH